MNRSPRSTSIVGLLSILTLISIDDLMRDMTPRATEQKPSRGHKKRARTRDQLIQAGLQVLANKGDALTISDVVAQAEVSNGTFYNYFADRDELIRVLAERSLVTIAAQSAGQVIGEDPAKRFALATSRVLLRAQQDPTWGRVILRLADHERSLRQEVGRYLQEDLAEGFARGRFTLPPDEITLDLVWGLVMLSIRRIVRDEARPELIASVVERALVALGVSTEEASELASAVLADQA
jgi:AcrR family transcriptional regulator